jgi:Fic family protein
MAKLMPSAGEFRTRSDLEIANSRHELPPHEEVPALVDEACSFVNAQPAEADPLFVAAYILWRICWVHPFDDGNGRTARAVSYLVLGQRLRVELSGEHPVPQRLKYAPRLYVRALEAADAAWRLGRLDVSELQRLLEFYLEAQLRNDPPGLPPWA